MNKSFTTTFTITLVLLLGTSIYPQLAMATHSPTVVNGDVFVSIGSGMVQWREAGGTLHATLDTLLGGFTTGCAFDAADNLYVTMFSAGTVFRFDNAGTPLGVFGGPYNTSPESIVFNAVGEYYVGHADGDTDIRHFSAAGALIDQDDVLGDARGSDWIDLAADQSTMFYTSEGFFIKKYDVVGNAQLADFNALALPSASAFALRIIPAGPFAGDVLVAGTAAIYRLDASGTVVATYDKLGEDGWFALNLDPDGASFWSADFGTADVVKFDIATGAELLSFNTGTGPGTVFGLCVNGELTSAQLTPVGGEVIPIDAVALLTLAMYSQPYWFVLLSLPIAIAFVAIKSKNRKIANHCKLE